MERLDKPEAKGILAFLGSTPPKSAEDAEKERKEREKASAEKRAEVEHKRSELRALRESWGLQAMKLASVVKVGLSPWRANLKPITLGGGRCGSNRLQI